MLPRATAAADGGPATRPSQGDLDVFCYARITQETKKANKLGGPKAHLKPALDALDSGAGKVSMFRGAAAIVHYILNLECSIVHRHPPG